MSAFFRVHCHYLKDNELMCHEYINRCSKLFSFSVITAIDVAICA